MNPGQSPQEIAGELQGRLAALRASALSGLDSDKQRAQHLAAIDHLAEYALLLRAATESAAYSALDSGNSRRYLMKLELPDGSWDLIEKQLPLRPEHGSLIDLAADGAWQVRSIQLVEAKPAGKPPYELFVCALAA